MTIRSITPALAAVLTATPLIVASFAVADVPVGVFLVELLRPATNISAFRDVVLRACPVVLCALAAALPGRFGLVNIGVEGQMILGCIGATSVAFSSGNRLAVVIASLIVGACAGAIWGGIPALLRTIVAVDEAIGSYLMNPVAWFGALWLLAGRWRETTRGWPETDLLNVKGHVPSLAGIHVLALLGFSVPLAAWFIFRGRAIAFHAKLFAQAPRAARYIGLRAITHYTGAFAVGGALAGLAGAIEVVAINDRLRDGLWGSFPLAGIVLAWLCRFNFVGIAVASLATAAVLNAYDALVLLEVPFKGVDLLLGGVLLVLIVMRSLKSREATYD